MTTTTHTGLIRVCSYCRRMIGDDDRSFGSRLLAWCHEMTEGEHITHGACLSCVAIERKKLAQYRREKTNAIID